MTKHRFAKIFKKLAFILGWIGLVVLSLFLCGIALYMSPSIYSKLSFRYQRVLKPGTPQPYDVSNGIVNLGIQSHYMPFRFSPNGRYIIPSNRTDLYQLEIPNGPPYQVRIFDVEQNRYTNSMLDWPDKFAFYFDSFDQDDTNYYSYTMGSRNYIDEQLPPIYYPFKFDISFQGSDFSSANKLVFGEELKRSTDSHLIQALLFDLEHGVEYLLGENPSGSLQAAGAFLPYFLVSPDRKIIAISYRDYQNYEWKQEVDKFQLLVMPPSKSIGWYPDGRYLAMIDNESNLSLYNSQLQCVIAKTNIPNAEIVVWKGRDMIRVASYNQEYTEVFDVDPTLIFGDWQNLGCISQ